MVTKRASVDAVSPIGSLLAPKALRLRAGKAYFELGQAYWQEGHVHRLKTSEENTVSAEVFGSRHYRIRLWVAGNQLDYDCTCPLGEDGEFCKHCVAVGLAGYYRSEAPRTPIAGRQPRMTRNTASNEPPLPELPPRTRNAFRHSPSSRGTRKAAEGKPQGGMLAFLSVMDYDSLLDLIQEAARTEMASIALWVAIADESAAHREWETAVPIYQEQLERLVAQKTEVAYRWAATLMLEIREGMAKRGCLSQYKTYLAGVRARHEGKRKFIASLAECGALPNRKPGKKKHK